VRDTDIRFRLRDQLEAEFSGDLIRNEMGLCLGETRVDLAVINGHLHGYEIKSERDTLTRLKIQIELYDRVLDYSTIVTSSRHLDRVRGMVPAHWGIVEARGNDAEVMLHTVRKPTLNRQLQPLCLAQLLWRDEAAAILIARGEAVRHRETRWDLWDRLALIPLRTLQGHVRRVLKERQYWPGG
jgi:hypothetical protein